jgi:flavin-dependent dehydrogenase
MLDVLVVGAGPAGAVAATVLARQGARVCIIDRARFPRDKLCGDTVNPGTIALLRALGLSGGLETRGLAVDGMLVTGPGGSVVVSRYPAGLQGRAIARRDLDWSLLQQAIAAGAAFEPSTTARAALVGERAVGGVVVNGGRTIRARAVIAADGRRSALAFGLDLARHPARPRRWAIGAYFTDVKAPDPGSSYGEMHLRRGRYIGVASIPGDLVNVCLVRPWERTARGRAAGEDRLHDLGDFLWSELARDPVLADRFARARLIAPPAILGPLAVDVCARAPDGLLLAGDAAGFIDPMTGDGLRFAVRGGELAARAALQALEHGWPGVHAALSGERRREFAPKLRFNRALRGLVAHGSAVRAAEIAATVAPAALRAVVRRAGDCAVRARPSAEQA